MKLIKGYCCNPYGEKTKTKSIYIRHETKKRIYGIGLIDIFKIYKFYKSCGFWCALNQTLWWKTFGEYQKGKFVIRFLWLICQMRIK